MGSAYTPGLAALEHTVVLKERRLPLKGGVKVGVGDSVRPDTVVASAERPGDIETIPVAEELDCEVDEAVAAMKVKEGDSVAEGDTLAEYSFLWGLFSASCRAPFAGKVEYVSPTTGHIGLRRPSTTIDLRAYVPGRIVEVFEGEGVRIETRGALVQGIFGIGGEATGKLAVTAAAPGDVLTPEKLPSDCSGRVIVAGMTASAEATRAAASRGAVGLISGGLLERDLREYLGYELGVAVTGHEDVPVTLVVTEGFGSLPMAERTFALFKRLDGRECSICGATQIRAGAVRPEVIVPSEGAADAAARPATDLSVGTRIRFIRRPHFGMLGRVAALPGEPVTIATGSTVRVLAATLDSGETVTVPRANVEIIQA